MPKRPPLFVLNLKRRGYSFVLVVEVNNGEYEKHKLKMKFCQWKSKALFGSAKSTTMIPFFFFSNALNSLHGQWSSMSNNVLSAGKSVSLTLPQNIF